MVLFAICTLAMTAALVLAAVVGLKLLFEIRSLPAATAELVIEGLTTRRADCVVRPEEEEPR